MSRTILTIIFTSLLLLCTGCSEQYCITVTLAQDHPWELASGRRFWYTLVWNAGTHICSKHMSIGQRSAVVAVPNKSTVVFAAYPLGSGLPFGGSYSPVLDTSLHVELTQDEGPFSASLLSLSRRWPEPVRNLNFRLVFEMISQIDPSFVHIDWNLLSKAIVENVVDENAFRLSTREDVYFDALPEGNWICEYATLDDLFGFSDNPIIAQGLPSGLIRYINLDVDLELRVVVPNRDYSDDEDINAFWHVSRADPIFLLSDAAYQELLEHAR